MITANSGPQIAFGVTTNSTNGLTGNVQDYNSQRGPSLFDLGVGMVDPRSFYAYSPGGGVTEQVYAFPHGMGMVDLVVSSGSSNAFLAASGSTIAAGTAITLAAASSGKATYQTTIIAPETGTTSETLIAIDSTAAAVTFGADGTIAYWNPAAGTGRCITVTATAAGDGGSWHIIGRDMYGYRMTEYLTVGTSKINTQKAFKYISSIISATTLASTSVAIGLTEIFGFPFAASYMGPNTAIALSSNAYSFSGYNVVTSSAGDVFSASSTPGAVALASTAATQTSTTPDVRGTYNSSTALAIASSYRLIMNFRPTAAQLSGITAASVSTLFGGTQFYSST